MCSASLPGLPAHWYRIQAGPGAPIHKARAHRGIERERRKQAAYAPPLTFVVARVADNYDSYSRRRSGSLSLLIVVAAPLFVRTLSNLKSINLGFNRENVLLFEVNARQSGHRDPEISEFYFRLREQLAAIPGARSASLARGSLLGGEDQRPISVLGSPPDLANRHFIVGPYFLTTMQIPILAGRDIDD